MKLMAVIPWSSRRSPCHPSLLWVRDNSLNHCLLDNRKATLQPASLPGLSGSSRGMLSMALICAECVVPCHSGLMLSPSLFHLLQAFAPFLSLCPLGTLVRWAFQGQVSRTRQTHFAELSWRIMEHKRNITQIMGTPSLPDSTSLDSPGTPKLTNLLNRPWPAPRL